MDLNHYLQIAIDAATMAGAHLRKRFAEDWKVEWKGAVDPVTEVDRESERMIVDFLSSKSPEADILAEEEAHDLSGKELCWVVDPLDATVNYAHRIPVFCVSIGLEKNGVPIVGAVFDPMSIELYAATAESQATRNDQPIQVSEMPNLDRALMATGFPYDKRENPENNLDVFPKMLLACQGIRRVGSAALDLCWTAAGRYDGYWELGLAPWDISAGRLIVERAGGKVTDFKGNPIDSHTRYILATNGKIHEEGIKILDES